MVICTRCFAPPQISVTILFVEYLFSSGKKLKIQDYVPEVRQGVWGLLFLFTLNPLDTTLAV